MNEGIVPESIVIARPDPSLMQGAAQFLAIARASYGEIATADECEAAGEDLKLIKARQKQLEEARTTITKPLLEAQRAINQFFRGPQETLAQAEQIVKHGILRFQEAEERLRRQAEASAAEALRKEREALESAAIVAERTGKVEEAEALRSSAASMPERMQLPAAQSRMSGIAARSVWRAELTDKGAFIRYVAEHPEWLHLVEANATALNGLARSQKSALCLPGVKVFEEKQLAASAR